MLFGSYVCEAVWWWVFFWDGDVRLFVVRLFVGLVFFCEVVVYWSRGLVTYVWLFFCGSGLLFLLYPPIDLWRFPLSKGCA